MPYFHEMTMSTKPLSGYTSPRYNENTSEDSTDDQKQMRKVQDYYHTQMTECIFVSSLQQVQLETLLKGRDKKIKELQQKIVLLKRDLDSKEQELISANKKIKQFENP
jgi:septal ring factor EnvC (AmiA/AmiB activator)